jgi:hypothetical protein
MQRVQFNQRVGDLELEILRAIGAWFASHGERFDPVEFTSQTSIDFDQLAREAHIYGADVMPLSSSGEAATSHRPASS